MLEFDGRTDSIFQAFDGDGPPHMAILIFHGEFDDLPYDRFRAEMMRLYPRLFVHLAALRTESAAVER